VSLTDNKLVRVFYHELQMDNTFVPIKIALYKYIKNSIKEMLMSDLL